MTVSSDMSTPVTRGELRLEFEQFEARLDARFDAKLDAKLEQLKARIEAKFDQKLDLWGGALMERMATEIARHTRAIQESMQTMVSAVDEKYADLPRRVKHLETKVFEPPRR
jgi:hypothetical protein